MQHKTKIKEPLINGKTNELNANSSGKNNQEHRIISSRLKPSHKQKEQTYIYPVSIISELFFSWTIRFFHIANKMIPKVSHLGKFSKEYSPNTFLNQILPKWNKISKSSSNKPLIKSLLYANIWPIIFIIILSIISSTVSIYIIILFRQILLHFQTNKKKETYFTFLNTCLLMLFNKLLDIFLFRFFEFYTAKIGAKVSVQINCLLYDKLLKISTFAHFSEGELINFIQIDAEKFSDFFSYSPGTLVLPLEFIFNIYLLFQYFGPCFLIGMIGLLMIFIITSLLEIQRLRYQKELLKLKDRRIKTTTQAFDTIKIVKLYSWEEYYSNKIQRERNEELEMIRKIQLNTMIINSLLWGTGGLISLISIITYNIFDVEMEISNVLTSIYIFNNLGEPLFLFPEYITGLFDSLVSLRRIEGFLTGKEWNKDQVDKSGNDNSKAVKINNLDFGIISIDSKFHLKKHPHNITLLKQINFEASYGELIGIVGDVGCGKTCFLNAILNNLDILNNPDKTKRVIINGSVSYVSQSPWILNDTLQNNILFFKEMEEAKYYQIVDICQLLQDFALLTGGDFTEIGDKGLNLSGGQKARIAIARALYSDSDIYIFDDPLSALDAYVGMEIFHKVIKEYLKGKTVIIATHALQYIPLMSKVYHLKDGEIDWCGSANEAVHQEFYSKYCRIRNLNNRKYSPSEPLNELCDTELETNRSFHQELDNISGNGSRNLGNVKVRKKSIYKLTKDDDQTSNSVSLKGLFSLFSYSGGVFFIILVLMINVFWKMCESGSDYILAVWTTDEGLNKLQNQVYLIIYSTIVSLAIIFIFSRTVIVVNGIIDYNQRMHDTLLTKLMQAPINLFHDMIPRGQILNRLSKDLDNTVKFFWSFNATFRLLIQVMTCVIMCITFNFYTLIFFIFLFFIQYKLFNFYIRGGKALNFMEGSNRSGIISEFSETMNGIATIRGYEFQERFRAKYHIKLDEYFKIQIYQNGTSNWFAMSIDLVCFILLFFILSFAVGFKEYISPNAIGLLLNYTLKLIDYCFNFFEQYTRLIRFMTSLERCHSFTNIVQEKSFVNKKDDELRKKGFPYQGKLTFINYSVKYRPETELVLKNLNFEINPREKIGVVGRTGSGKSTLCLCCFRILEPFTGKILIDNVDITTLGLKFLREILTVIPQDPTLIEGTLRNNLDPTDKFTDEQIIKGIKEIGIEYMLKENGLNYEIKEGGQNLSVGERQLICITRAILRKSKIVIMDEATSSIDYKTETLLQNSMAISLKDSTVITIAHRIKTIIKYDRIFVLQDGELVENGKPSELIKSGKGIFYQLYIQSNI